MGLAVPLPRGRNACSPSSQFAFSIQHGCRFVGDERIESVRLLCGSFNPCLVLRLFFSGSRRIFFGVNRDEPSEPFRVSLRSCSASRARLSRSASRCFRSSSCRRMANSGSHQSGYEIANEALDSLHFGITPACSLLVFSP